jgi:hypothetical protein
MAAYAVSSPPMVMSSRDIQAEQRCDRVVQEHWIGRWIGTRDPDKRSASKMDSADSFDREWRHLVHLALHDVFEAIADTKNSQPIELSPNRGCADHRIDSRCRTASDKDCRLL